jgi:hypothetical protein
VHIHIQVAKCTIFSPCSNMVVKKNQRYCSINFIGPCSSLLCWDTLWKDLEIIEHLPTNVQSVYVRRPLAFEQMKLFSLSNWPFTWHWKKFWSQKVTRTQSFSLSPHLSLHTTWFVLSPFFTLHCLSIDTATNKISKPINLKICLKDPYISNAYQTRSKEP